MDHQQIECLPLATATIMLALASRRHPFTKGLKSSNFSKHSIVVPWQLGSVRGAAVYADTAFPVANYPSLEECLGRLCTCT